MNSPTLRLNPRFPLVWRTPTSLQLGIDAPVVRLDSVTLAEEHLLHSLLTGVSLEGLRMIGARSGGAPGSASRLLRRVAPALLREDHGAAAVVLTPTPLAGRTIAVVGGSAARPAVQGLLRQLGAVPGSPVELAVIVSSWSTPPPEAAAWLRRDIPHLDVVFSDTGATVGPLVVPGGGACLHCRERHRIEREPSWPAIAGQLYGRPAPTEVPLLIARVLPVVASLCVLHLRLGAGGDAGPGAVTHLDAITGEVRLSRQAVHPQCACRALPETVKPSEPASDSPPSRPTTAEVSVSPG